jgi:hypothetical protein
MVLPGTLFTGEAPPPSIRISSVRRPLLDSRLNRERTLI